MDSKLTNEQRERFSAWIAEKATFIGKCPVCGQREWGLLDDLLEARAFFSDGGMRIGGPIYPHVGMFCANCGNTQFINAIICGVVDNKPPEPPASPDKAEEADG